MKRAEPTDLTDMTDVVEVLEPMGGEQAQAYQRLRTHLSELRAGGRRRVVDRRARRRPG